LSLKDLKNRRSQRDQKEKLDLDESVYRSA
jgi:hypothetical protein